MRQIYRFCSTVKVPTAKPVARANPTNNEKPELPKFSGFQKLNFRIGKIIKADKHEGSESLYWLQVDLGDEQRTVATGLSQHVGGIEQMNGLVVLLTNIKQRRFAGIESTALLVYAKLDQSIDLVRPTGIPGDKLFIENFEGESQPLASYKVWEYVRADLKTNSLGQMTYKDELVRTKAGLIISKLKDAKLS